MALVGDRLTTDMAMADAAGMVGVLVLSGVATPAELAHSSIRPRYVIEDLTQLLPESTTDEENST